MRRRNNGSSNSRYAFDSGGNAYSCSYSNITMSRNNISIDMSSLQEGLGYFNFSETKIPDGITITNIIIDNPNFFIENFGCSGDINGRNLLEEAYGKVSDFNFNEDFISQFNDNDPFPPITSLAYNSDKSKLKACFIPNIVKDEANNDKYVTYFTYIPATLVPEVDFSTVQFQFSDGTFINAFVLKVPGFTP